MEEAENHRLSGLPELSAIVLYCVIILLGY